MQVCKYFFAILPAALIVLYKIINALAAHKRFFRACSFTRAFFRLFDFKSVDNSSR
jgi:hypothetical protein